MNDIATGCMIMMTITLIFIGSHLGSIVSDLRNLRRHLEASRENQ